MHHRLRWKVRHRWALPISLQIDLPQTSLTTGYPKVRTAYSFSLKYFVLFWLLYWILMYLCDLNTKGRSNIATRRWQRYLRKILPHQMWRGRILHENLFGELPLLGLLSFKYHTKHSNFLWWSMRIFIRKFVFIWMY